MGVCIGAGFPNFVMYWLQLTCLNWVVFHILLFSNILFMELETGIIKGNKTKYYNKNKMIKKLLSILNMLVVNSGFNEVFTN